MSVEQFGESGGSRRQVETDLRQNGVGKTVKIVNTNYSFRSLAIKRRERVVVIWGYIICKFQFLVPDSHFQL